MELDISRELKDKRRIAGESHMNRALKESFFKDLREGRLRALLDVVKRDDTLCLELRGKEASVYYRGGLLLTIEDKWEECHAYHITTLNEDY